MHWNKKSVQKNTEEGNLERAGLLGSMKRCPWVMLGSDKFDAIVNSINRKKGTDLMVTWLNLGSKTAEDTLQANSISTQLCVQTLLHCMV